MQKYWYLHNNVCKDQILFRAFSVDTYVMEAGSM